DVAVIGYVTAAVRERLGDDRAAGLYAVGGMLPLTAVFDELRSLKPHLTVLLAQAGRAEVEHLAAMLPPRAVDLIVVGEGSTSEVMEVAGIPAVAPGDAAVAVVDLLRTPAGGHVLRPRLVSAS